jgi:negative regulator of sigma E activity
MNHPKPEEWVPYLYGEARPDIRRQLNAHLQRCPECHQQIQSWKRSLGQLDTWKIPSLRRPSDLFAPVLRLAAAAVVLLSVGFGMGRFTAANATAEKVRAAIEPQLRQELKQQMAQLVHEEVNRTAPAALAAANEHADQIAATWAQALWFSLKKDVDTVAVHVDAGLRDTQELIQLAGYNPATDAPQKPQN